jgi:hypothetical protein
MLAHSGGGTSFRDVTRFAQNPEAIGVVTASSIGRSERDLDAKDRRIFNKIAGPLLIELGYAKDDAWQRADRADPEPGRKKKKSPLVGAFQCQPGEWPGISSAGN